MQTLLVPVLATWSVVVLCYETFCYIHYRNDIVLTPFFTLADGCPDLFIGNGSVSYDPAGNLHFAGTTATYTCNDDYVLDGMSTSTCGNGTWTGSAPVCLREYSTIYKPCSLTLVSMSDSSELHYYIYSW